MSTPIVPKKVFFTNGVGSSNKELRSFEFALRDAGIEKCNLTYVSSILPSHCRIVSRKEGLKHIVPGMITHCVMARCSSNEPRRLIAASIGCAVPADKNAYGYISEVHGFGKTQRESGNLAEDLAAAMLSTTLGLEFDENKAWDERKQEFKVSGKIIRTTETTQSAMVKTNSWTTVIAAAVFL